MLFMFSLTGHYKPLDVLLGRQTDGSHISSRHRNERKLLLHVKNVVDLMLQCDECAS